MITIKSVLYLALAGVLLLRPPAGVQRSVCLRRAATLALAFAGVLAALWAWHRSGISMLEPGSTGAYLKSSTTKLFLPLGFVPRWRYFANSLRADAAGWLLIGAGGLVALVQAARGKPGLRSRALTLLGLALPLATLLVYRNAYPYFYVLLLSPAVILSGLALDALLDEVRWKNPRRPALLAAGLVLLLGFQGLSHAASRLGDENQHQKAVLAAVHQLFPEPVRYIDRCSMVASFEKVGLFMSTWGLETYLAQGQPLMRRLLAQEQPRFLLVNAPSLEFLLPHGSLSRAQPSLLPEDREVLRDHFLPHWGSLLVAGRELHLAAGVTVEFEILIAGSYTVEAEDAVTIDGLPLQPGATVLLYQGQHTAASPTGPSRLILRWGDRLPRPTHPPPLEPLFRPF